MITMEGRYGLRQTDIEKIQSVLKKFPKIQSAILYGSRALGNYHTGSDIDLTLKGEISISQMLKLEYELDDLLLPYKIDLSIFNTISNPDMIDHIERVGKIFYEKC